MPARPLPDPPDLPPVVTHAHALLAGMTEGRVRNRLRSGRWSTLAPGMYLRAPTLPPDQSVHEMGRHLHGLRAQAFASRRSASVIGRESAAILHGLPLVTGTPQKVRLLVGAGMWSGTEEQVIIGVGAHLMHDMIMLPGPTADPVAVTTVARTWVDIARLGLLADALSVGDAALRERRMTRDDAAGVLERLGRVRGCRRAARALELLNPLRESPLESASAARFFEWGFPEPRLQHTWRDAMGDIARSDFDWDDQAVIGFADGMEKYGLDPSRDRAERHQESRLRPHGTVARWGWVHTAGTGLALFRLLAPLLRVDRPFPRLPERW